MQTQTSPAVHRATPWFWLIFLLGMSIGSVASAVDTRNFGLGMSGIGFAFVGAFAFAHPIPLTTDIIIWLRRKHSATEPQIAALGLVGTALIIVGLIMRWV